MPTVVQCPHCPATLNVRDEYVGRQMRCPRCKTVLDTTPARPSPPPPPIPPVARALPSPAPPAPVRTAARLPAAPPRSTDDADDKPAKERRPRDEEDDDRPRPQKRVRDQDDRPRRRSRPKKRKKDSSQPLLLSLIGGAVVLCGALFAAVWFGRTQPTAERVNAESDRRSNEGNTPAPGQDNTARKPVSDSRETAGNPPAEVVPLPSTKPDDQPPPPGETVIPVAAADLTAEFAKDSTAAAAKYEGKWLKVTGVVSFTDPTKGKEIRFADVSVGPPNKAKKYRLACLFEGDASTEAKKLKHPDRVFIVGKCGGIEKSAKKGDTFTITLNMCRVEK